MPRATLEAEEGGGKAAALPSGFSLDSSAAAIEVGPTVCPSASPGQLDPHKCSIV